MGKRKTTSSPLRVVALLAVLSVYPFSFTLFPSHSPIPKARAAGNEAALISTATPEGGLAVFDDAWARINERYYDQRFHGLDWEAQRTTFRTLAAKAGSSQHLYSASRRMIASLNDLHTRRVSPDDTHD